MIIPEENVYSIIGEEGFQHLVAEFYSRIPTDSILGPMYTAADLAGAEQRLRDFFLRPILSNVDIRV
jgi:hemoglobin